MSPAQLEDLRRLHFINALFAPLTGDDLYLARQIQQAIAFSLAELEEKTHTPTDLPPSDDDAFNAAAARLLGRLLAGRPGHGFFHWDALSTLSSATPLFARAELMAGLKRLAPFRESTLLVTNLRAALLPRERRATERRRREYEDALDFVRDLTAARTRPDADFRLLLL
jgi:hypothetical protein